MDEPSTGLDPASRNNLWNVVKQAKKTCAIILTSTLSFLEPQSTLPSHPFGFNSTNQIFMFSAHSMEEAEALCDRLAFYVAGGLECVGYPKEVN